MSTRRARICIVTTDFPPSIGGIQTWTVQIATELARRHAVTVIAPRQPGCKTYDRRLPFRVLRYLNPDPRMPSLGALAFVLLAQLVRERQDVVLFSHLFPAVVAHPLCRLLKVPYVLTLHGRELFSPRIQRALHATVQHSRRCLVVSRYTAGLLRQKGIESRHMVVVPNGVDSSLLAAPLATPPRCLDSQHAVILTIARLEERHKGHDTMLRALPLIAAKVPQVRYVIAGEGSLRRYYEHLAHSLSIEPHVVFTGRVDDEQRLALYDRCNVFAMISREEIDGNVEGFGIVFLEAAARGKPVVGGDSGGIPDAIVDGGTGLLVDPIDIVAVADACILLLTDGDLASRLGEAGRARVQQGYTWALIAHRIEQIVLPQAGA